jgi:hypothetical protein
MRRTFVKESFYSVSSQELFELHERPDAFRLLSPPDFKVEVHNTATTIKPSEEVVGFTIRVMGVPFRHGMVHTVYQKPDLFIDEQLHGPFATWKHEHRFIQAGWEDAPATMMQDRIDYAHPLLFAGNFVVSMPLGSLFEARHEITRKEMRASIKARRGDRKPKHVVITGATGLIGGRLTEILVEEGERVTLLVRNPEKARRRFGEAVSYATWDFERPEEGDWKAAVAEADALVHLAGTPLFSKRWTPEFKRKMKESRTASTRQLVEFIKASDHKPSSFVSASAVGIYGMDPTRLVSETSPPDADDLLADICIDWEKEARAVESAGVRAVQIRIGVVLDKRSGALKEMLPLFLLGGGGVLGQPDRWLNWIHLEDCVRIFHMAIFHDELQGPVNAVGPHPVSNKTFAHTLAHVLRRPCLMRYPEALIRMGIGEAGKYAAGSPRATADLIREKGYTFFFQDLESALRNLLGRPRR